LTPTHISGVNGLSQIASGGQHTCAVDNLSNHWCWGLNIAAQLGLENRDSVGWVVPLPTKVVRRILPSHLFFYTHLT